MQLQQPFEARGTFWDHLRLLYKEMECTEF